jgi:hypothetical protein
MNFQNRRRPPPNFGDGPQIEEQLPGTLSASRFNQDAAPPQADTSAETVLEVIDNLRFDALAESASLAVKYAKITRRAAQQRDRRGTRVAVAQTTRCVRDMLTATSELGLAGRRR